MKSLETSLPELSPHDALQLRQCIQHTLERLITPAEGSASHIPTGDLIVHGAQRIHSVLTTTISDFAYLYNKSVLINTLPLELLSTVFHWLPLRDLITATHVCKSWREVALANGSLWGVIQTQDLAHLGTMLQRSQAALLTINLQLPENSLQPWTRNHTILPGHAVSQGLRFFDESLLEPSPECRDTAKALLASLRPHMSRIRDLYIRGCWASRELAELLSEPAPRLSTLALYHSETTATGAMDLPLNIFAGNAPRLRKVMLSSISFCPRDAKHMTPGPATLQHVLQNVQYLEYQGQAAELWPIVRAAKRIPEVLLHLGFEKQSAVGTLSEERPLRRLLSFPGEVRELDVSRRGIVRVVNALTGYMCTVYGDPTESMEHFFPTCLEHVVKLGIDETSWIRLLQGDVHRIPQLAELSIAVKRVATHVPGQQPLTLFDQRLRVMECPSLAKLTIIGPREPVDLGQPEFAYILPAAGINGRPARNTNRRKAVPLADLVRFLEATEKPIVVLKAATLGRGTPMELERLHSMVKELVIDTS